MPINMIADQILNYEREVPGEVVKVNKPGFELFNIINQLYEADKQFVFKIIATFLTKNKFRDFFQKNIAAL